MKKAVSLILSACLLLALCACGAATSETEPAPEVIPEDIMNQPAAPGEGPLAEDMPVADAGEGETEDPADVVPVGNTLGTDLQDYFLESTQATPGMTAAEAVNALMAAPAMSFGPVTGEVVPGYLTGFDNTEITGFEEGVMFAPMIGTIPFVGYVFRLAEGADVQAFVTLLHDNANPRWNICTEADQVVTAFSGDLVFFVMCPYSLEG